MGNPMSLILNSTGGGSVTIQEPVTASNFTQTLPATTGTMALTSDVIGVGQTWQSLTGSRALGTTYTNSTGKPIAISVSCANSGSAGATGFGLTVGGVDLGFSYIIQAVGPGNYYTQMSAIVPNGATYKTTTAISATLANWSELR